MFSAVDSFDEIALDYPTTIASPKKYLLPAKETLFEFDAENNEVTDYTDEVRPGCSSACTPATSTACRT